jgi:hypothetical protein
MRSLVEAAPRRAGAEGHQGLHAVAEGHKSVTHKAELLALIAARFKGAQEHTLPPIQ